MATPGETRFKRGVILVTLALCAFFLAEGATALLGARVMRHGPDDVQTPRRSRAPRSVVPTRHDAAVILRRNIFNAELGDLTQVATTAAPGGVELTLEEGEEFNPCDIQMELRGTAVIPGDLDRSIAAIMESDRKTSVYQGAAEVGGTRIRAIRADAVILETGGSLCRLAMFTEDERHWNLRGGKKQAARTAPKEEKPKPAKKRSAVDRNAGLSEEEIAQGIDKVNDTTFNVRRTLLNKVLDNAGKLIGIAAVSPKLENGQPVGMQIRGVRPNTLLAKLGVNNGDVLESVNGQPLSSPDAALGAYTTLRTADKFTLSVQRGGAPIEINYNLN
ncbi:MAG: type II secretion system protein GspC [Polyangiales bacterium]